MITESILTIDKSASLLSFYDPKAQPSVAVGTSLSTAAPRDLNPVEQEMLSSLPARGSRRRSSQDEGSRKGSSRGHLSRTQSEQQVQQESFVNPAVQAELDNNRELTPPPKSRRKRKGKPKRALFATKETVRDIAEESVQMTDDPGFLIVQLPSAAAGVELPATAVESKAESEIPQVEAPESDMALFVRKELAAIEAEEAEEAAAANELEDELAELEELDQKAVEAEKEEQEREREQQQKKKRKRKRSDKSKSKKTKRARGEKSHESKADDAAVEMDASEQGGVAQEVKQEVKPLLLRNPGAKRHSRPRNLSRLGKGFLRQNFNKPAVHKLKQLASIPRWEGECANMTRMIMYSVTRTYLGAAARLVQHKSRKRLQSRDIVYAAECNGQGLYRTANDEDD